MCCICLIHTQAEMWQQVFQPLAWSACCCFPCVAASVFLLCVVGKHLKVVVLHNETRELCFSKLIILLEKQVRFVSFFAFGAIWQLAVCTLPPSFSRLSSSPSLSSLPASPCYCVCGWCYVKACLVPFVLRWFAAFEDESGSDLG